MIIHFGYQEEKSKHCGFHIYNKNRLIRMYQRFGAWSPPSCIDDVYSWHAACVLKNALNSRDNTRTCFLRSRDGGG